MIFFNQWKCSMNWVRTRWCTVPLKQRCMMGYWLTPPERAEVGRWNRWSSSRGRTWRASSAETICSETTAVTISLWIDLTVISTHYVHFVVYIQKRFFIYFGVVLTHETSAHLLEIISCPSFNFVLKMYLFFSLATCHSIRNIIWLMYYFWWQSLVYINVSTAITNHCFSFWNQKLSNT